VRHAASVLGSPVIGGRLPDPALWGKQIYNTYHAPRSVNCPETHAPVSVRFDAFRAAITGLVGPPKLRLADCSRWPVHADCGQGCIPDAVKSTPAEEPHADRTKSIALLPVLIGAAVAWAIGMAWHSQFVFRANWASALGLTNQQVLDLADRRTPHLITVGACLLYAYCIAWLMNWLGRRSLFLGIRVGLGLWFLFAAVILVASRTRIPHDLMWIEGIYTLLAALLIGAITGGLPRRVFLKDPE